MGKLTWQQLGMIYEGSFGVDPKEAAEILSDHLFVRLTRQRTHSRARSFWWKDPPHK